MSWLTSRGALFELSDSYLFETLGSPWSFAALRHCFRVMTESQGLSKTEGNRFQDQRQGLGCACWRHPYKLVHASEPFLSQHPPDSVKSFLSNINTLLVDLCLKTKITIQMVTCFKKKKSKLLHFTDVAYSLCIQGVWMDESPDAVVLPWISLRVSFLWAGEQNYQYTGWIQ